MSPFTDSTTSSLVAVEGRLKDLIQHNAPNYCGQMLLEHLDTGGKRLRANVTLQLGELFNVDPQSALHWATAVELLHNATLIHDDIQDGDTERRNQPSTWVVHGVPQAINAGDLGLMLPFQCIDEMYTTDAIRWRLSKILSAYAVQTVCGQSLEMTLLPRKDFSLKSYREAALGKTGAFFALPMDGIAHLAELHKDLREDLVHLFSQIGLLFQMQDDILDCFGDKGRLQGADICEGKVSLLVVSHLALHPQDTSYIERILTSQDDLDLNTVRTVIDLFESGGALDLALHEVQLLEHSIESNDALLKFPALQKQVSGLLDKIMTPIEHLLPKSLEASQ